MADSPAGKQDDAPSGADDTVQLAGMRLDARALLRREGYTPLAGTIWVRGDSAKVNRPQLAELVESLVPPA